jgi:hypothetical protein
MHWSKPEQMAGGTARAFARDSPGKLEWNLCFGSIGYPFHPDISTTQPVKKGSQVPK